MDLPTAIYLLFNHSYKLVVHCLFSIAFYFIQSISLSLSTICISFRCKFKFYSATFSINLVSTNSNHNTYTFIIKGDLNWFETEELQINYFLGLIFNINFQFICLAKRLISHDGIPNLLQLWNAFSNSFFSLTQNVALW